MILVHVLVDSSIDLRTFQFARKTRNRGQSPRDRVAESSLFSVADGRFDPEIERVEGLRPVVDAPFAPLSKSSTGGGAALTSD